jgi:predicted Rossmann fold nucleotide-binding protein DprA/Smf involved in DNA uptake
MRAAGVDAGGNALTAVAVTGSRDVSGRGSDTVAQQFATFLGPFARIGARFLLGGAAGIDTLALDWLSGAGVHCVVAVPVGVADQPAAARRSIHAALRSGAIERIVELDHPDGVGPRAWDARNRWLVEHCGVVVGFPASAEADMSGTWATLRYAVERDRATLVIPPNWRG